MDIERKKIVRLIKEKGLKKSFVAKKIGVSTVFFSYWINGKKDMSEERMKDLKKFLNIE